MKAFVLMAAMPPTTGHLQLIKFANRLPVDGVDVLVCTQSFEPFPTERFQAISEAVRSLGRVKVHHYSNEIEQNPEALGFWDMWKEILSGYGVNSHTVMVASEPYGKKVADLMGTRFMPYDFNRQLNGAKASWIRDNPLIHFDQIIPEFQRFLRTKVTIFGAESTGKTTLARELGLTFNAPWLFEWARSYLEIVGNEITLQSMCDIWDGQYALQCQADEFGPLVIQDTDLYSTIGYWEQPHWETDLGPCPYDLKLDAEALKSDLYLITRSDIPFEQDPLRYGGDHRESSDEYWIEVCKKYDLPYVVLEDRFKAEQLVDQKVKQKIQTLAYDRHGL